MRCPWSEQVESMWQYHDIVWGAPEYDDQKLLRKLMPDINQTELSWRTILNRSEAFNEVYDRFDIKKVANYGKTKISKLMENREVVRSRRKIEAAVQNARAILKTQEEISSFPKYLWSFSNGKIVDSSYHSQEEVSTMGLLSDELAKDLKRRGFESIGSITTYAFLEAIEIINGHLDSCFRKEEVVHIGRKGK